MELEYSVSFGREKKRADIVIFDKIATTSPYVIYHAHQTFFLLWINPSRTQDNTDIQK